MRNHNQEYPDTAVRKYAYDFDRVIRKYLMRTLEPWFRRPGSALELGCYKGDMTAQILEYFPSVTVVEAASDLARVVSERFPNDVTVINAPFEEVRLEQKFDNVFLVHTLEHLDDPVGVLRRTAQWMSGDGRLFVAVPNANALSRQIAVRMGLIEHNAAVTPAEEQHGHRRTYATDVLLRDLTKAGYIVEDYGGILVKGLANYQFDQAIAAGIVTEAYLDACQALARSYPDICASIFAVCVAAPSSR